METIEEEAEGGRMEYGTREKESREDEKGGMRGKDGV